MGIHAAAGYTDGGYDGRTAPRSIVRETGTRGEFAGAVNFVEKCERVNSGFSRPGFGARLRFNMDRMVGTGAQSWSNGGANYLLWWSGQAIVIAPGFYRVRLRWMFGQEQCACPNTIVAAIIQAGGGPA